MAKAREIIKRRKAVENIRKITRTMELIATARFRKAMDRATEAEVFTRKIAELVSDLGESSTELSHPLLQRRDPIRKTLILVLTSNRGLAGGYNGNVLRVATKAIQEREVDGIKVGIEVSGKRGITYLRNRKIPTEATYTQFVDKPQFSEVEVLADEYINKYVRGEIDQLEVVYTQFVNTARQVATIQTLLPIVTTDIGQVAPTMRKGKAQEADAAAEQGSKWAPVPYEFVPDAKSILEEIVPVSFKVRLFKCFLDTAVSEQIARMVAMRGATQNADDLVKSLTRQYNRARQSQITSQLAEIVGAVDALK